MKRIERLQAILIDFQNKRLIKAQSIADEYGTTLRTVYRDIKSLQESGVPIEGEAGVGYSLSQDFHHSPVHLSQEESLSLLVVSKFINKFPDEITKQNFEKAIKKVRAVLPDEYKDQFEFFENRIEVLPGFAKEMPSISYEYVDQIRAALYNSKMLSFEYYSAYSNEINERSAEPLGLVFYGEHWHLIAWCHIRKDYRDFRVDRMKKLKLLAESFRLEERMNLQEYGQIQKSKFPLFHSTIKFTLESAKWVESMRYYWGFTGRETYEEDGVLMEFAIHNLEYFARWLLSFTNSISIVGPIELKETFKNLVKEMPIY